MRILWGATRESRKKPKILLTTGYLQLGLISSRAGHDLGRRPWQLVRGDATGCVTREGNFSRINAAIAEVLSLLRDDEIDLIILASDQSGSIELHYLFDSHVTGGAFLIEGD